MRDPLQPVYTTAPVTGNLIREANSTVRGRRKPHRNTLERRGREPGPDSEGRDIWMMMKEGEVTNWTEWVPDGST